MPSFCSTMWVRLSRDTLSLQLHTAEPWMSEAWGSEDMNRTGSPNTRFMMGLEETRVSVRMKPLTLLRCLSRSWRQGGGRGG